MPYDLAFLDNRVVNRLSLSASDTRITSTVRYQTINDALEQISLEHDWPWLLTSETISTVAGTATRALPTGYVRTDSIVNTTHGQALRRTTVIDIDQIIHTGVPVLYHSSAVLTWGPTPDAVYSLKHRFHRTEPTLVATTDVPLIPQVYARGVVEYAAMLCLQQIREHDMAASAESNYGKWLKRVTDNVNQSREPVRVRLRPGAWF